MLYFNSTNGYIVIFLHYLLYIESYMLQGLESGKPYPLGIGMLI